MKRNSNQREIPKETLVSVSLIFLVTATDQLTKLFVVKSSLPWSCNLGFAFGILPTFLNGLIAFSVLLALVYLFFRQKDFTLYAPFSLILGGGIANLADRIFRGCVVDFVRIPLWPATFNLADLAITIGVSLMVFSVIEDFLKKNNEA